MIGKKFGSDKTLGQKTKNCFVEIFLWNKFFWSEIFLSENVLDAKLFWSKFFWCEKKFVEIFFSQKFFGSQKKIWSEMFWVNIILQISSSWVKLRLYTENQLPGHLEVT